MKTQQLVSPAAGVLACFLLAACGGSSPSASNGMPAMSPQAQLGNDVTLDKSNNCRGGGGGGGSDAGGKGGGGKGQQVSVHPCNVKLTLNKPDVQVTTNGPAGGTFTVDQTKCNENMVATITKTSGQDYTVAIGTNNGSCTARFIDRGLNGHKLGSAKLKIETHIE
jgi:hypothetical protein